MNERVLTRRAALGSLAAGTLAAGSAGAAAGQLVRCEVLDQAGEPLPVADLERFHICDLVLRPIPIDPIFGPGEVRFQPVQQPFRISLPLTVPGFGQVFVYADNRGAGHTARSLSKSAPLLLNYEFAADRLATVHNLAEECRRSGLDVSAAAERRLSDSRELLKKADAAGKDRRAVAGLALQSLSHSLWAGEMLVVDRAQQLISKRGARPGFLFGCNAFGYPRYGKPYTDRFEALFNYATLPFYPETVEPTQGQRDYSQAEKILGLLENTRIVCKGHTFVFFSNSTPQWLRNKPFEETKRLCLQHVRASILKFRHKIHVWDVVNEMHVQPELECEFAGFTKEQNVEMTAAACRMAREADPTCCRLVNNTGTWCDYYMGRVEGAVNPGLTKHAPWQQSVYDYLQRLRDARVDYDVIGLQYYHAARDLLEFERNLESFKGFGKQIHLTELGIASSSEEQPSARSNRWAWWAGGIGVARLVWHGERHTEQAQADWAEGIYTIAFSKPYVDAVTWWNLSDPAFIPNGGLLRADGAPKPAYERLIALLAKWREMK